MTLIYFQNFSATLMTFYMATLDPMVFCRMLSPSPRSIAFVCSVTQNPCAYLFGLRAAALACGCLLVPHPPIPHRATGGRRACPDDGRAPVATVGVAGCVASAATPTLGASGRGRGRDRTTTGTIGGLFVKTPEELDAVCRLVVS